MTAQQADYLEAVAKECRGLSWDELVEKCLKLEHALLVQGEMLKQTEADLAAAQKEVENFRSEAWVSDAEIGVFQDRVRALIIDLAKCPDSIIDGKGSDAGWEEFTLAEIGQGIAFVIDQREAALKACASARQLAEYIVSDWEKSKSWEVTKLIELARHALSLDYGRGFIPVKELEPTIELLPKLRDKVLHRSDCESVASHRRKSGRPNNVCTCGAVDLIAASNSIIARLEALKASCSPRSQA